MPGEPRGGESSDPVNPEEQENQEIAELREFLDKIKPPYIANIYLWKGERLVTHEINPVTFDKDSQEQIFGGTEKQQNQIRKNEVAIWQAHYGVIDKLKDQDLNELAYTYQEGKPRASTSEAYQIRDNTLYGSVVHGINGKDQTALMLGFHIGRADPAGRGGECQIVFFTKKENAEKLMHFFENQADLPEKINTFQGYMDPNLPVLQPSGQNINRAVFGRIVMMEGHTSVSEIAEHWKTNMGYPGIEKVF